MKEPQAIAVEQLSKRSLLVRLDTKFDGHLNLILTSRDNKGQGIGATPDGKPKDFSPRYSTEHSNWYLIAKELGFQLLIPQHILEGY